MHLPETAAIDDGAGPTWAGVRDHPTRQLTPAWRDLFRVIPSQLNSVGVGRIPALFAG
jgi:hypothetical protein